MDTVWTAERTEQLLALHAQGKSYGQIAETLGEGFTKNSCLSKAKRLGVAGHRRGEGSSAQATATRPPPTKPHAPPKPRGKPSAADAKAGYLARHQSQIAAMERPEGAAAPVGVPFLKLRYKHCRWPVQGRGINMRCCGAEREREATSYCTEHRIRSRSPADVA